MTDNFWKSRKVLITGGTGLIGTYVVKALLDKEATVYCLVQEVQNDSNFVKWGLDKKVHILAGTVLDYNLINLSLCKHEIDTVFHLAAQPLVRLALEKPYETLQVNCFGTLNVLEACRLNNIKRIIIASSDKAYGSQDKLPYTESSPLQGTYPYDVSKSVTDLLAQSYGKTYSLPVAIARFSNVYGGGDLNFDRIVPETIKHLLLDEPILIRSNGKFIREFFYVKDAARAYLALAENVERLNLRGEAFNFGTDTPVVILDLVNLIKKISGKNDAEIKILDTAKAEIKDQFLSSEKARKVLGWEPKYNLEDGLKETYQWYKEHFKK